MFCFIGYLQYDKIEFKKHSVGSENSNRKRSDYLNYSNRANFLLFEFLPTVGGDHQKGMDGKCNEMKIISNYNKMWKFKILIATEECNKDKFNVLKFGINKAFLKDGMKPL